MKLSKLERKVLKALYESANGNGHDFGLIEEARGAVAKADQLGGVVASLVKKGIIEVHKPVDTGDGYIWTQFTWVGPHNESYENVEAVKQILFTNEEL